MSSSTCPALLALGAPSVASYLRLVPQHWAGAYACWGLENREAAIRMVTGSTGSSEWAANLEVKCVDLLANPYLLLAGLLATGSAGMAAGASLPEPVDVDPAALGDDVLEQRGIRRLPMTLRESTDAFAADGALREAFGDPLGRVDRGRARVGDRAVRRHLARGRRRRGPLGALS